MKTDKNKRTMTVATRAEFRTIALLAVRLAVVLENYD